MSPLQSTKAVLPILALVALISGCSRHDYWLQLTPADIQMSLLGPDGWPLNPPNPEDVALGNRNQGITKFKAAFAVRGMGCVVCHAQIDSNVVTDFELTPDYSAYAGLTQPALSVDTVFGNRDGSSWQGAQINGTVYVPRVALPADKANIVFGVNRAMSFKDGLLLPGVDGNPEPIMSGVNPPAGGSKVVERNFIQISYPTESEITGLVPDGLNPAFYVGPTRNAAAGSAISGIGLDGGGKFVRNTGGVVSCNGDVLVTGTLFLNNLVLDPGALGCRLYVSESVFIQGPIRYAATAATQHLQISSARGVIMGFSARRLGANPDGTRTSDLSDGFNWIRLSTGIDYRYVFGKDAAARTAVMDRMVADSVKIGSELKDAADSSQFSSLAPGATVSNGRMVVPYKGLLLNAPHVHSLYTGLFSGVIIADVAIFPLSETRFAYDSSFDNIQVYLPALPRPVFTISSN